MLKICYFHNAITYSYQICGVIVEFNIENWNHSTTKYVITYGAI